MSNSDAKPPPAILLCGHGSRDPEGAAEFLHLVGKVQKNLAPQTVTGAFLEFNSPAILPALQDIYEQGHREIIVQPVTLYNAGHTKCDIPEIMAQFTKSHPGACLRYGSFLGLIQPVINAAISAIQSILPDADPEDCKLLVIGRGSRDRMVADQTINLCQKLHDWMDFGDSRYCYSFESAPLLETALTQAAQSHYPHVVVLPFLLFSGRLLSDIYGKIDAAAEKYPAFTFHKVPHLGPQDFIADAVIQQINLLTG